MYCVVLGRSNVRFSSLPAVAVEIQPRECRGDVPIRKLPAEKVPHLGIGSVGETAFWLDLRKTATKVNLRILMLQRQVEHDWKKISRDLRWRLGWD